MTENDVLRAIKGRRSVLRFGDDPVSDEQLEAILEAGRWAPSYINSQPWEFIVIRELRLRARAAEILRRVTISWQGFAQAPAIIIVAVDISTDPRHFVEDGAAAATNMTLMAHSVGLASFWAGVCAEYDGRGSPEDDLRALLSIPRKMRIISALPIGVAAYQPDATRRPLAEMVHRDGYTSGKAKSADRGHGTPEHGPRSA